MGNRFPRASLRFAARRCPPRAFMSVFALARTTLLDPSTEMAVRKAGTRTAPQKPNRRSATYRMVYLFSPFALASLPLPLYCSVHNSGSGHVFSRHPRHVLAVPSLDALASSPPSAIASSSSPHPPTADYSTPVMYCIPSISHDLSAVVDL